MATVQATIRRTYEAGERGGVGTACCNLTWGARYDRLRGC